MKWFAFEAACTQTLPPLRDSSKKLHNVPEMTGSTPYMKPLRWFAHLPLIILPLLAARTIEGPRFQAMMQTRVEQALSVAGQDWAKVTVDGRDVEIRGVAPSTAAVAAARAAVAGIFGVGHVDIRAGTEG